MKKQTDEKGNPLSYWGGLEEPKQLTAVEWLVEELNKETSLTSFVANCDNEYKSAILSIIQQAKEMENKQLKEMYLKGIENYDPTFKNK
jgi:hypothetical protein